MLHLVCFISTSEVHMPMAQVEVTLWLSVVLMLSFRVRDREATILAMTAVVMILRQLCVVLVGPCVFALGDVNNIPNVISPIQRPQAEFLIRSRKCH